MSRTWSYETSVLLRKEIANDIPYNNFIEWYAPTYQLHLIPSTTMENKNTTEYLDNLMWGWVVLVICRRDVFEHLSSIEGAPSVQMQHTPPIFKVERPKNEEDPEAGEDSRILWGEWWIEACIDEYRRSEAEFYDGPTDIDHGDGTEVEPKVNWDDRKWIVCYEIRIENELIDDTKCHKNRYINLQIPFKKDQLCTIPKWHLREWVLSQTDTIEQIGYSWACLWGI